MTVPVGCPARVPDWLSRVARKKSDRRRSNTDREAEPVTKPDPRHYQIGMLAVLLVYGVFWLDFEISGRQAAVTLVTALVTQYVCSRVWGLASFDPRSALISGLSL